MDVIDKKKKRKKKKKSKDRKSKQDEIAFDDGLFTEDEDFRSSVIEYNALQS